MTPRYLYLEGLTSYTDAHQIQRSLLMQRIADEAPDVVLLLEHEETITVGRQRGA